MGARRLIALALVGLIVAPGCGHEGSRSEDRGDQYSASGNLLDARVEYELAVSQAGSGAPFGLRLKAAELALASKDFEAADTGFAALVSVRPDFAERAAALYQLHAERWLAAGDTFAAMRAIDWIQARDSTANLGRLHYVLGDLAFSRPDYGTAVAEYRLGLASAPGQAAARVYARLGEASSRQRNCVAAVSFFRAFLERVEAEGPEAESARHGLGTCALRLAEMAFTRGDYERAMEYVQSMITVGEPAGRLPEADLLTARLHEQFGNRQAAMAYYGRVVRTDEELRSRPAIEAFRRLKQLEFGMPLRDGSGENRTVDENRRTES